MGRSGEGMRPLKQRVNRLVDLVDTARLSDRPPGHARRPQGDWRRAMPQHPEGPPPDRRFPAATWALTGCSEAVTQARDHVREFLTAYDHAVAPATLRDSLLVVSELVTNAVMYAPGPCVLHIEYRDGALAIAVRDTSPALPVPRVPDPASADGGLGWHLLTGLTSHIDVQPDTDGGKTITAVLGLPARRSPAKENRR
jgi:anti-sigma regulatory factor (Ser/Thr protein kinase)